MRSKAFLDLELSALYPLTFQSGSRKRSHSPALGMTIYAEVGKRRPEAQNPARLSRKELEGFRVYPEPLQLSPLRLASDLGNLQ